MERLGLVVVKVGGRWREGPGVPALLFAVRDEFLRGKGVGRATDDVLEESPKTVEEHGAGDGYGDKEDGDDSDANYLPCFARVIGDMAFRGHWQDGRCRGYGGLDGGGFGGVGRWSGCRRPLFCRRCGGYRRTRERPGEGLEGVASGIRREQGAGCAAVAAEQADDVSLGVGGEGEDGEGQGQARGDKHVERQRDSSSRDCDPADSSQRDSERIGSRNQINPESDLTKSRIIGNKCRVHPDSDEGGTVLTARVKDNPEIADSQVGQ